MYRGAGTVEFLVDSERETFYFLEMNARIQVEHPVTEAVAGVDLMAEQIAIAAGDGLRLAQADIQESGCAIECRVMPKIRPMIFGRAPGGCVMCLAVRRGIRVDTYIESGSRVPPFYDSLMAKIIAHAPDRAAALTRLRQAISSTRVAGIHTNLPFHRLRWPTRNFRPEDSIRVS